MTHYYAAYTEGECIVGCEHKHKTVISATACISSAGGYVVAVTKRKPRELTDAEEDEFQLAMYGTDEQKKRGRRAYLRMLKALKSGAI
jgi:hypothetical protein